MKLRYFGYHLREFDSQEPFLYNIKPLIDAFVKSKNVELKTSFKRGDERLYLTSVLGQKNLYYFVRTSDDDLIKRINESSITVSDISDKLSANEKVAFASYVYICPIREIVACASGMSCPRFDDLTEYLNEMFRKVGLEKFSIGLSALTYSTDKVDLLEMEVVNSIYIDIASDRGLGKEFVKKLTGKNTDGLGNFRITIEPSDGNMKDIFRHIVRNHDTKNDSALGIVNIGARAKHDELKGQLMDHWLDNENTLYDSLNPKAKRRKLPDQICEKYDNNTDAPELFKTYAKNNRYEHKSFALLDRFKDVKSFAGTEQNIDTSKGADNDDDVIATSSTLG